MNAVMIPDHWQQGSDSWLEYRRSRGNASELAALMNCSPWFPRTPYELWLLKTGRQSVEENAAMRRGSALEPLVRAYCEQHFAETFEPAVKERGRLSASLDGIDFGGQAVLEIKCPVKGRESETWQHVEKNGMPPDNYWWQVQAQLLCAGAKRALFVVAHEEGGEIRGITYCTVAPDMQAHTAIEAKWAAFFEHLDSDTPPPLTDRDVVERKDAEWRDAVAAYKAAKHALKAAEKAEKEAKAALIKLADGRKTLGCGLQLTPSYRKGSVDYSAIPELAAVDLDKYRKDGGKDPVWTITESKSA